jgi:hypothetical protein
MKTTIKTRVNTKKEREKLAITHALGLMESEQAEKVVLEAFLEAYQNPYDTLIGYGVQPVAAMNVIRSHFLRKFGF